MKTSVMILAAIMGRLLLIIPKESHSRVPIANSEYMNSEMPLVSLDLMVFMACGKKEDVVKIAAVKRNALRLSLAGTFRCPHRWILSPMAKAMRPAGAENDDNATMGLSTYL